MSGAQLVRRIVTVTVMTVAFFLLLSVIRVEATPIKPDVRKLLAAPAHPANEFVPARAGWDGPEMPRTRQTNLTYEQIGPAATAREVQRELFGMFVPDFRAVAAILLIILLLRRLNTARRVAVANVIQGANSQQQSLDCR